MLAAGAGMPEVSSLAAGRLDKTQRQMLHGVGVKFSLTELIFKQRKNQGDIGSKSCTQ